MLIVHRRRRIAGGYLYQGFVIWRNKHITLGSKGAWHIFVHGKKRDFASLQDVRNNIDSHLNLQKNKVIKF